MDKEFILAEIVRTAAQNSGVALGGDRFYSETGIKNSDWLGKYWPRWSDAVREAGVEGSRWQTQLDETALLNHYIGLVRDLGHVPVAAEIRIRAKNTPGFPWHNTFQRLGSKARLVAKALAHCQETPGCEDVAAILQGEPKAEPIELPPSQPEEITAGYVYMLRVGRDYKVGRSNAFDRRSRELSIQLPEQHETVHVIATDDAAGIEAYWHSRFAAQRKNGEWFALSAQQVKAFKRRKFM